jgi:hypothetical protein
MTPESPSATPRIFVIRFSLLRLRLIRITLTNKKTRSYNNVCRRDRQCAISVS